MILLALVRGVLRVAAPLAWVVYGIVALVKHRREESVRALTRATVLGVGIAFVLCAALIALTLLI